MMRRPPKATPCISAGGADGFKRQVIHDFKNVLYKMLPGQQNEKFLSFSFYLLYHRLDINIIAIFFINYQK
ncbi:hypothetical protein X274_10205 [Marinitoga sp. 1155]|nr:hypothetical protein X274_10205 [Marinitoga sp. 1155]